MGELIYSIRTDFRGVTPILPQLMVLLNESGNIFNSSWAEGDTVHLTYYGIIDVSVVNTIIASYVPDYTPRTDQSLIENCNKTIASSVYTSFYTILFRGSTYIKVSVNAYLNSPGSCEYRILDKTNNVVILSGSFTNTDSGLMITWGATDTVSEVQSILEFQCNTNDVQVNIGSIKIEYVQI